MVQSGIITRAELFRKYKGPAKVFIETGTQNGDGIRAAILAGFELIFSFEINAHLAAKAENTFADMKQVTIFNESSAGPAFERLVSMVDEPALYWLDAHRMDSKGKGAADYPLIAEISTIAQFENKACAVLCDDRRLFARYGVTEGGILDCLYERRGPVTTLEYGESKPSYPDDVAVYIPEGWLC